jgi:hypothetical protein
VVSDVRRIWSKEVLWLFSEFLGKRAGAGGCAEPVRNERRGSSILRDSFGVGVNGAWLWRGGPGWESGRFQGNPATAKWPEGARVKWGPPFILRSALEQPEPLPAFG